MAKVWKKLQRADGDFTGTVNGTAASTVVTNAATGAGKPKTFKQNDPPTSLQIGDIWYDTNDNNIMYFAESVGADQIAAGEWVQVKQGKGANSYDKDDVGLGNLTNHTQIKSDGSNAPNILKNDQISISSGGVLSGAGGGTVTPTGIGAVDTDLSNAPNTIKNNQISISAAGVLSGAGGGTVTPTGIGAVDTDLSNAPSTIKNENTTKSDVGLTNVLDRAQTTTFTQDGVPTSTAAGDIWIDTNDGNKQYVATSSGNDEIKAGEWVARAPDKTVVGLSNVTNDAQIKTDGSNAPNILKNDQVSISAAGVLSGAGGGTVTPTGIGAVDTDLSNAPNTIKNSSVSISAAGVLSGAGGGTVTATGVGAIKTDASNAPNSLKNAQITLSSSGGTVTLNNAGSGSFGKSDIGLSAVVNQAITMDAGKLKFDGTAQTIDADKVGGSTSAQVQAAAVTTAKDDLIGDAPGALDTLQELADVFGDDANYAAGVTASIATKAKAPVTISNPSSTPTEDVGVQGIYADELYVVQDV